MQTRRPFTVWQLMASEPAQLTLPLTEVHRIESADAGVMGSSGKAARIAGRKQRNMRLSCSAADLIDQALVRGGHGAVADIRAAGVSRGRQHAPRAVGLQGLVRGRSTTQCQIDAGDDPRADQRLATG